MLPYVIVLDLDGTIVGDVSSHINEWVIMKCLRTGSSAITFNKNMRSSLQSGLLRPYFADFMNSVYSVHGIEVFVYTASTSDWAPVVIANVESVVGKKFNRPIFTRDHCITSPDHGTTKSLQRITPAIFNKLKRKYADLRSVQDLNQRILMIDNTDVLAERWAWLPCPTYDYVSNYDILKHVDNAALRTNFACIARELQQQGALSRGNAQTYDMFMAAYYSKVARSLAANAVKNQRERQDVFWSRCVQILVPWLRKLQAQGLNLTPQHIKTAVRALS
jgi:hypothetical protein